MPYVRVAAVVAAIAALAASGVVAQQTVPRFGGGYAGLDARRQHLIDNWVARFAATTGQRIQPASFYNEVLSFSTKTTFDAVTHALMTTSLTDVAGGSLGDALALVDQVESVKGEIDGAASDRQFRLYVRLAAGAMATLARSQQFKRGADNSIFHKGYPINYRGREGVPAIQISATPDGRRADVDVDYRSASFPIALFNGHLSAANSDVRAGNNFDRHAQRWLGFENWWRSFFGVRTERAPEDVPPSRADVMSSPPRIGKANIELAVQDFLKAWLVEGDVAAAMAYISPRAYACLAQDQDDPANFDRGMAPFQLMMNLKAAHDALGPRASLEGLMVGVRYPIPELRVVRQPHHPQFVITSVPDNIAMGFDCESRLTLGDPGKVGAYGTYHGATFYIAGQRDVPVALLWARDKGYWKIVSWKVGTSDSAPTPAELPAEPKIVRLAADPTLVQAARGFLDAWLIRKDYDATFAYLSPASYACYDLVRSGAQPPSSSLDDAGRRIRAGLASSGDAIDSSGRLEALIQATEPRHPAIRVMDHGDARLFSLSSMPNALADLTECEARARGDAMPDPLPLEYGEGFAMTLRFRTKSGDAPVLRLLWRREAVGWRIRSYDIELP